MAFTDTEISQLFQDSIAPRREWLGNGFSFLINPVRRKRLDLYRDIRLGMSLGLSNSEVARLANCCPKTVARSRSKLHVVKQCECGRPATHMGHCTFRLHRHQGWDAVRRNLLLGSSAAAVVRIGRGTCKRGHAYSNRNTYIAKSGQRVCRQCSAYWSRLYRSKTALKSEGRRPRLPARVSLTT